MESELQKQVVDVINSNINFIRKYNFEKLKNKYFIDIILNNTILNIIVDHQIKVNLNDSINKYLIDFYKDEKSFQNIHDFKTYLDSIIRGYHEKTNGLFVKYQGEEFVCDIEIDWIDPDRSMGTETLYVLFFIDNEGEEVTVAEVSEYPIGIFEVYNVNEDVEIIESEIKSYFEDKYHSYK